MKSIFCLTKTIFLFNVLCVLFPAETSANVAAFLERQRQLAEEQWNSNDEGLKYEDDEDEDEATGSGAAGTAHRTASTGSSEYQYVYVDEDGEYYEANGDEDGEEDDEEEEPEPVFIPKKKKFKGYKKYAGRSLRKCDPYDLEDVIVEVVNLGEGALACPIRNESQMMKLRDDHQLNLRMIKKQIQEERRGLAPTLSVDPTQPNQKKPIIPTKEAPKELEIGTRVMARYQGKTKYIHGVIKDKKKGGTKDKIVITYDIKYDTGADESRVAANLIIPLETEAEKTNAMGKGADKKPNLSKRRDQARQSFKEMQEERRRKKEEQYQVLLEEEKDPGRVLDADCESQICMACKFVVDEFADIVHRNIDNTEVEYLYDLVDYKQKPFCESPQIVQRYTPVVNHVCDKVMSEDTGNRDMFTRPFEEDTDWHKVKSPETLLPKKEHICVNTGMCDPVAFEFEIMPDQDWGSDQCFVCHALLDDLEDKISLQQKVTEGSALGIAKSGCDNLKLPDTLAAECKMMTEGKMLDDIGWILKLFKESLERKEKVHRNFPDRACEELLLCKKWVDPNVEVEPEIEAIFS